MSKYKINIEKKVLRLLGAQLYGDTPSIIAELVQNAYDADAHKVWITIKTKQPYEIVVQDNGAGMTPDEINTRFLNIGYDRRDTFPVSPGGRKVLGRKGIGNLAVFSLAKIVDVFSMKDGERAACRLDFDNITLNNGDPEELDESGEIIPKEYLSANGTGTRIVLHDIQKDISRSFNYILNRILRTFDVNAEDIIILIRKGDEEFKALSRKELDYFGYLDTIVTFGDDYKEKACEVQKNSIEAKYKIVEYYDDLAKKSRFVSLPCTITVMGRDGKPKDVSYNFSGWIGTISKRQFFDNFVTKTDTKAGEQILEASFTDNRITVFSRGKIGEFDILPKAQTNRIADAYIIGELYVDIFEDDSLIDMAISNRRGYDETDQRYIQLVEIVKKVVAYLTLRKQEINSRIEKDKNDNALKEIKHVFISASPKTKAAIDERFSSQQKTDFDDELHQFCRAINLANTTKRIFISHKSELAVFGEFLVRCFELIGVNTKESIIFTAMPELGVPYDQEICEYLKGCFRVDLYVIFLFSRAFYDSNMCVAETGAAWATNKNYSNVVIDIGFGDIDKPLNNGKVGLSFLGATDPDRYRLRCLLRNALSTIGFSPMPSDERIDEATEAALQEFNGKLVCALYMPKRKFLASPLCPKCASKMILKQKNNGDMQYECSAGKCDYTIPAQVDG